VITDDGVVDLTASGLPSAMTALLEGGADALAAAAAYADRGTPLAWEEVELLAPVPRPGKFLAIGLNYADHIAETGREAPAFPTVFNKQITCVNAPGAPIHIPRASSAVDYEGELAMVIGRRCRHVARDRAAEVIAGYTIVNDVSVRDWQRRSPTMIMGKGWDTHGPMGPWLVTADEIGDPHQLDLRTWVNDELRQSSNTRELIFDCFTLIETLTTAFTLEPGDVIATGTPSGVGVARDPKAFLEAGDRVRIEISGIGELANPVIAEPADTPTP
jgi:2-keto-4-pentenoate hydratase/2-oxohepta-3-ene-1,7-dioic acid hydratase in catechol pathway